MPRGSPRLRTPEGKLNLVALRVRQRRAELKLTQDGLCARLAAVTHGGWVADRRDVFRIEDGRRSVHDLEVVALAEALECDPCWLLTGTPAASLPPPHARLRLVEAAGDAPGSAAGTQRTGDLQGPADLP